MDTELRSRFNADFTPEKYTVLLRCVNETEKWPADFRISETPVFLTRQFTNDVTRAANEIIAATRTPEFFVFDKERKLVYTGALDDSMNPGKVTKHYLVDAVEAALKGEAPKAQTTRPEVEVLRRSR